MTDERTTEQHVADAIRNATTEHDRLIAEELRRGRAIAEAADAVCACWRDSRHGAVADAIDKLREACDREARASVTEPAKVAYLRTRTTSEHADDFIAHATRSGNEHTRAVAAEIQRLRGVCAAYHAGAAMMAASPSASAAVSVPAPDRVQELLEANTRYVEEARAAKRDAEVVRSAKSVLEHQLTIAVRALLHYEHARDMPAWDEGGGNRVAHEALDAITGGSVKP